MQVPSAVRLGSLAPLALLAITSSPFALAHDGDPKLLDYRTPYQGPGYRLKEALDQWAQGMPGPQPGTSADYNHKGVKLLSFVSITDFDPGFSGANDCWGYTSPSGREYALLCMNDAAGVVEITDAANAQIVATLNTPFSFWRDMKVYDEYAYSVSEGGSGIQVFDLTQIDSGIVTHVTNVTAPGSTTSATHNVALNEDTGFLYRCGGSDHGLRIYSLANPASPTYVTSWDDRYVHDANVVTMQSGPFQGDELAFCNTGLSGGFVDPGLTILNVTNKASIQVLAQYEYSETGYSHQGWLSPDQNYFYINDEFLITQTFVINVQNPASPIEVNNFTNGAYSISHNLYTRDNLIFEANYSSGLRVFDATNPVNPVEIGHFDTSPDLAEATTANGLWSNFPFFDSDVVIGSDRERGLFVWWVGEPQVSFSFDDGPPEVLAPQGAVVQVHVVEATPGALNASTVNFNYVDPIGGPTAAPMSNVGGDLWEVTLPAIACGEEVDWFVSAESVDGIPWTLPENAPNILATATSGAVEVVVFEDDMESPTGWSVSGSVDSGEWERVDPAGTLAAPEDDHTELGTQCFVTQQGLSGEAVGTSDVDGGTTTLTSPSFDLSSANDPVISYWRWFSNDTGAEVMDDTLDVEISTNGVNNWVSVESVGPAGPEVFGGWYRHQFKPADFVALGTQMRVRFHAEDEAPGANGASVIEAALDDFRVVDLSCTDCNQNGVADAQDILSGSSFDMDGNGQPDDCQPLSVDTASISVSAGGTQTFALDAGSGNSGELYWLLGSVSGTSPGLPLGLVTLPLNVDFYFNLSFTAPNIAPFVNTLAFLDGSGQATAQFTLPAGTSASLAGIDAYHAFLVYDLVAEQSTFASNYVTLSLVP